jgi:hypothetical protein
LFFSFFRSPKQKGLLSEDFKNERRRKATLGCARFFSGSFVVITARFAAKLCTPYFNRETYRVVKKKKGSIRRANQNSFSRS